MNGSLRLLSEPGKFCRWIIQLPLTLSAADAALIQIGGQVFALPLSYVDGGVHMGPEDIVEHGGQTFYHRGEEFIPLSQLGPLLGLSRPVPHLQQAVIINTGGFRAAIGIERLIGREQIVIKSLGPFLDQHPLYSGATLDAQGRVVLILNAPHLAAIIRSGQALLPADVHEESIVDLEESRSLHVLVVDDSLSVRKSLEKHLLQFDCDVTLASDGVDALDKMRNALFDVIFTDLEMPNMDGFQLLVEARGLELWAHVPIYVVTSRAVDKYTQKALALGATGFLAKPVGVEQLRQVLADVRSEAMGIRVETAAV
jgi:chemosensory pili system protein ChpA (sensor histidine kinase/response regulator)